MAFSLEEPVQWNIAQFCNLLVSFDDYINLKLTLTVLHEPEEP